MGGNKRKLVTVEPKQQMTSVYNKRKNGFAKKGRELSILCDTPVLVLCDMIPPVPVPVPVEEIIHLLEDIINAFNN